MAIPDSAYYVPPRSWELSEQPSGQEFQETRIDVQGSSGDISNSSATDDIVASSSVEITSTSRAEDNIRTQGLSQIRYQTRNCHHQALLSLMSAETKYENCLQTPKGIG